MKKKILSLLLVLALCMGLGTAAFASGEADEGTSEAEETGGAAGEEEAAAEPDAPVTDGADITNSGTCGEDLTWTLDSDGVLTISGEGEMTSFLVSPWNSYRTEITSVVIESGVTTIWNYAFRRCTGLTSVTIPDSVESIGDEVFYYCTSLTDILVSDGNPYYSAADGALYNKDKTELIAWPAASGSVEIPDGVAAIGTGAFYACGSLTDVAIPDSVTTIGADAFGNCDSLETVDLGNSVTAIGGAAFSLCGNLTGIIIPASVETIGASAFGTCTALASVVFLGDAPAIGSLAFLLDETTVYYPAGNGTWTEDIMRNYGGSVTWTAYGDLSEIPDAEDTEAEEVPGSAGSSDTGSAGDTSGSTAGGSSAGDGTSSGGGTGSTGGSGSPAAGGGSYLPGDINEDGTVNISDVQTLLKTVNGQSVSVNDAALDVNGDGTVNISDVQTLLKYVNGQDVTIC